MTLSAIVHTYNAEKYLTECLASLQGVDEIVVCDMYSTDSTLDIARQFGCKVVFHENMGFAEPARNFAIEQASGEWILVVDADEIIPPALMTYLREAIQKPDCPDGIVIARNNNIWGRCLRAVYPDYHVRLFRKASFVTWPPLVHRGVVIQGTQYAIPKKHKHLAIYHYNFDTIAAYIQKLNTYTTLEVEKLREKRCQWLLPLFFVAPAVEFIKCYVLKGGFKDGYHGWIFAMMRAFYEFVAVAKLWEYKKNLNAPQNSRSVPKFVADANSGPTEALHLPGTTCGTSGLQNG